MPQDVTTKRRMGCRRLQAVGVNRLLSALLVSCASSARPPRVSGVLVTSRDRSDSFNSEAVTLSGDTVLTLDASAPDSDRGSDGASAWVEADRLQIGEPHADAAMV